MDLKSYLKNMTLAEQDTFAVRCGTTRGHLRNVAYGMRPCGESLAIEIDRESKGQVTCEVLRPDVDWAYLRGSTPRSEEQTAGR